VTTELFTAYQVRQLLDVDKSTVYRMAADGRLRAIKVGRQWRFPAADVHHLLQHGTAQSGEPASPSATPAPTLDGDAVQVLVEAFAASLGVMMVVTDMQGRPLTAVANPCPWFLERQDDPALLDACVAEWRDLAGGLDFEPAFRDGELGFECARAFIRSGPALVGMVLAGGVTPEDRPGLYHLDEQQRTHVLRTLPKVAAAFSRLAGHPDPTPTPAPAGGPV
jgi:excisionase family DNA binding protein